MIDLYKWLALDKKHKTCRACGGVLDYPLSESFWTGERTKLENVVLREDPTERLTLCAYCGHMMVFCPETGYHQLFDKEVKVIGDSPEFMEIRNRHVEFIFKEHNFWG